MYCPKCGTNVDDSFNFCFKCGFDFSAMKNANANISNNISDDKKVSLFNYIGNLVSEGEAKTEKGIKFTSNMIDKTVNKIKGRYEFASFNGSQESFEKIYCDLCYEKQDFEKLVAFLEYVTNEGNNINLNHNNVLIDNVRVMHIGKLVEKYGVLSAHSKLCANVENVEDIVSEIISVVNIAYYYKLIGERNFRFCALNYNSDKSEDIAGGEYISSCGNVLSVDTIVNDAKKYITVYSEIGSGVYSKILDNAIKFHKADYLSNMYPTQEQITIVMNLIIDEISSSYRCAECGINNLIKKSQEYNHYFKVCNDLHKENDNWVDSFIDGAVNGLQIGMLFAINPVLGGAKALHYGKRVYDKDKKETQRCNQMVECFEKSFNDFLDEYIKVIESLQLASVKCNTNLENNVGRKYLLPAISSIFEALKANGVKMLPIRRYLE